jgi:hypothetical protein
MHRKACSELAEVTLRRKALIMLNFAMLLLKLCAKLNFALKNEKISILAPLPNALCIP